MSSEASQAGPHEGTESRPQVPPQAREIRTEEVCIRCRRYRHQLFPVCEAIDGPEHKWETELTVTETPEGVLIAFTPHFDRPRGDLRFQPTQRFRMDRVTVLAGSFTLWMVRIGLVIPIAFCPVPVSEPNDVITLEFKPTARTFRALIHGTWEPGP